MIFALLVSQDNALLMPVNNPLTLFQPGTYYSSIIRFVISCRKLESASPVIDGKFNTYRVAPHFEWYS